MRGLDDGGCFVFWLRVFLGASVLSSFRSGGRCECCGGVVGVSTLETGKDVE